MKQDIRTINNLIKLKELDLILNEALEASEADWALFNEKINGVFWENKRLITDMHNSRPINYAIDDLFPTRLGHTITNKVQRFFYNDTIGPMKDNYFNEKIKFGSVLFLNNVGEISFPELDITIEAEPNKFIVYPATTEYVIRCNKKEIMYFITIFFTSN